MNLSDSIVKHCGTISRPLLNMHLRRMPESYLDRFSPAEIARHLKLAAKLDDNQRVDVEVKPMGGQALEIVVVGYDRTGVLAAITTALASDGLDVQDLVISTYLPPDEETGEPTFFVDVARVNNSKKGVASVEIAKSLRERLMLAFKHLEEGDLAAAQTAASDSHWTTQDPRPRRTTTAIAVKEGMVLDGFRLEEKIASGGMSEIYTATQISLGRTVAVKVVVGESSGGSESAARFTRETQVLAGFNSPYIVPVYAAGNTNLANGVPLRWLAMEYLVTGDVANWLKRSGPPRPEIAIRWFTQALQGLQYAHQRSILHRDVKPHNLLITGDGDVKVTDFGLLKHTNRDEKNLTMHGTVMGTPQYIAPEQALGEDADERSDIYSLGATFFQVLSGRPAFEDKSATAILVKVTRDRAPSLGEAAPHLERPWSVIIDRMLAPRPELRYQSIAVILEEIRSYQHRGLMPQPELGSLPENQTQRRPTVEVTQALRKF